MITRGVKSFYKRGLSLKYFIYSLLFFAVTVALIVYFPPSYELPVMGFRLSIVVPFFIILFLFIYCLGRLIIRSKKHAIIIGLFVVSYLLFRLNGLTHPLFLILLIALFLVIEFLFTRRDHGVDKQ